MDTPENIPPVQPAELKTTNQSFDNLGLSEPILECIRKVGFVHPTPIQTAVIPTAVQGKDLIGLAQTGSGKTAAFVLPIAERLHHGEGLRGLILCPTREIALQTQAFLDLFGQNHHLNTVCLIGGVRFGGQLQGIKNKPDIIVATPGRFLDHLRRRTIRVDKISELVLDEADHMMDLGFMPQIRDILKSLPRERHTMMFSATMPDAIERLAHQFLKDPIRVDLQPEGKAAEGVTHRMYLVDPENKAKCLLALLKEETGTTMIFMRRKLDTVWVTKMIRDAGHPVDAIHSDRSQSERTSALAGFRGGEHRVLVATDIASRGIDVPGVEHIINFDIPETVEDYIHRAGRTARANALGTVSTIASWMELPMVKQIEATIGKDIPRCQAEGVPAFVELKRPPAGRFGRRRR